MARQPVEQRCLFRTIGACVGTTSVVMWCEALLAENVRYKTRRNYKSFDVSWYSFSAVSKSNSFHLIWMLCIEKHTWNSLEWKLNHNFIWLNQITENSICAQMHKYKHIPHRRNHQPNSFKIGFSHSFKYNINPDFHITLK